jgi:hypothetical protein
VSGFNYRFSIIPAGAITDQRLTPRALQILCLLGRHTNDHGWCSRSQVKMAKELGCSRGAIQDGLELLYSSQWVEKRPNGRGQRSPESSDYPFAAYSYRVLLDRENLPAVAAPDSADQEMSEPTQGGAAVAAGGATPAAGGATMAAPLEGISSQGIPSEPERETRARERKARGLVAFEARWPTAAADARQRTAYVWGELSEADEEAALAGIAPFLENLKRLTRKHVPAGWKYLEERRWEMLAKPAENENRITKLAEGSHEAKALIALCDIGNLTAYFHRVLKSAHGGVIYRGTVDARLLALASLPPRESWMEADYRQARAWDDLIGDYLKVQVRRPIKAGDRVPWPWPPNAKGETYTQGESTGPPRETVEGTLSTEDDLQEFAAKG